jgi:hypothetical protein
MVIHRLSRAELHDQIEVAIVLKKVDKTHNSRMVKLSVDSNLQLKPLQEAPLGQQQLRNNFARIEIAAATRELHNRE